jgi:fermentation-respiration switch protein FrsA (DUF1100 family)
LIIAVSLYAIAALTMYVMQKSFIYHPDAVRTPPAEADLPDVAERVIDTPDGEKLIVWYGKAQPGQPTILYFHGNAGALETRRERIRKYLNRGRGMFMLSYRGFSGSTGTPSEAANVADAKLAYDTLLREGVRPEDIIIYGESLGTGVAIQLALEKPAQGLILDSAYTSLADRGAEIYWWLPVQLMMTEKYESRSYIARLTLPVFFLHGEADEVVSVAMARKLYALANEPKEIVTLPGAGHADHWQYGSFEAINAWIDRLRAGTITNKR